MYCSGLIRHKAITCVLAKNLIGFWIINVDRHRRLVEMRRETKNTTNFDCMEKQSKENTISAVKYCYIVDFKISNKLCWRLHSPSNRITLCYDC